ncbi:MAG: 2'-5' RNA ligase family protein [Bradyrhizobium sp.]|nr:2'-5' RNA ligase family protein [Bradyrhizobium sp.]
MRIIPDIAEQLAAFAAPLNEARGRLVAASDIHLTLVPPWQETSIQCAIERLSEVAKRFAPFSLRFLHVGYGPQPSRPRLLWTDCADGDELVALATTLMIAFGQQQTRPFRPHVTLARLRDDGRHVARKYPIDRNIDMAQSVTTVELFRSPAPGATGYEVMASVALAGTPPSTAGSE